MKNVSTWKLDEYQLKDKNMNERNDLQSDTSENFIVSMKAFPNGENRIKTVVDLSSIHANPNVALSLFDADEQEISHAVIMETVTPHIEFTLHIRKPDASFPLRLVCTIYKEENQSLDSKSILIDQTAQ